MTQPDPKMMVKTQSSLSSLIRDTLSLLEKFEATGMDATMPDDYENLQTILHQATQQQRALHKVDIDAGREQDNLLP